MKVMDGLKYSTDHEWVKLDGNRAYIGITDYAQNALGSIVFVELPAVGKTLINGDVLGVVESVKAASDIYSPISGAVVEVNRILEETPDIMNREPYESWIAVLEVSDADEADGLMNAGEYREHCAGGI